MPDRLLVVRVFVASPSDVQDERAEVAVVIAELNKSVGLLSNVRFEFVGWETDTYPGFGSDAQAVINSQIDDDYDIFIGILWVRFGTATPRAESGTQEEFDRALSRHKEDSLSVELMLYFKTDDVPLAAIDAHQFEMVQAFRKRVSSSGGRYQEFKTTTDFAKLVRVHLTQYLRRWQETSNRASAKSVRGVEEAGDRALASNSDEPGVLDLLDSGMENLAISTEVLGRIGDILTQYAEDATQATSDITSLHGKDDRERVSLAKQALDRFAGKMLTLTTKLQTETESFGDAYSIALVTYSQALEAYDSFAQHDKQEVQAALTSVGSLKHQMIESRKQLAGFKKVVASLPPLTGPLIAARAKTTKVLALVDSVFAKSLLLTEDIERTLQEILDKGS